MLSLVVNHLGLGYLVHIPEWLLLIYSVSLREVGLHDFVHLDLGEITGNTGVFA